MRIIYGNYVFERMAAITAIDAAKEAAGAS